MWRFVHPFVHWARIQSLALTITLLMLSLRCSREGCDFQCFGAFSSMLHSSVCLRYVPIHVLICLSIRLSVDVHTERMCDRFTYVIRLSVRGEKVLEPRHTAPRATCAASLWWCGKCCPENYLGSIKVSLATFSSALSFVESVPGFPMRLQISPGCFGAAGLRHARNTRRFIHSSRAEERLGVGDETVVLDGV